MSDSDSTAATILLGIFLIALVAKFVKRGRKSKNTALIAASLFLLPLPPSLPLSHSDSLPLLPLPPSPALSFPPSLHPALSLPTRIDHRSQSHFTVVLVNCRIVKSQTWNEEIVLSTELDLPMFDLDVIDAPTDHFSTGNLLGEGGFGPVYKVNQLASLTNCSFVELQGSAFLIFEL